nr:MAG TPA: hypothetical protein [Caudoviricetes sp.]
MHRKPLMAVVPSMAQPQTQKSPLSGQTDTGVYQATRLQHISSV